MSQSPASRTPPAARWAGWCPAAAGAAVVAGAFCLLVAGLLLAVRLGRPSDPQMDAGLVAAKAELAQAVAGGQAERAASLRRGVHELDLQVRDDFFRRQALLGRGGWLLAAGAAALVLAASAAAVLRRRREMPAPLPPADEMRQAARGRVAVTLAGALPAVALAAAAIAALLGGTGVQDLMDRTPSQPPPPIAIIRPAPATASGPATRQTATQVTVATGTAPAPTAATWPSEDERRANWPGFRGPTGDGIAYNAAPPTQWDGPTKKNVLWKTPIPLPGHNSPVVWGKRVFLTGATKSQREVYCLDADTGRVLWKRAVESQAEPPEVYDDFVYAACTAVTDGRRVAAIFASGDIACFDVDGNQAWTLDVGPMKVTYGHASSLAMWRDLLLVQLDSGQKEDGESRLLALDIGGGSEMWKASRPVGASWATPIVIDANGRAQVIACGDPMVIAHNAADGNEIWRADVAGGDGSASPIYAGGLVLAIRANYQFSAIAPGDGDLTEKLAWKAEDEIPDIASPVSDGKLVWTLTTNGGTLFCRETATGRQVYKKDIGLDFNASPTLAGGKLYLLATDGTMVVVEAGREYKEVGRCNLGEPCFASPAFVGDRIYIRSAKNLWCVGSRNVQ